MARPSARKKQPGTKGHVPTRVLGVRPGGRAARVVCDVIRAAIAELAESGYVAMRMEAVAERAAVSKTTVYRRWPTKAALVRDAVGTLGMTRPAPPDTGSLEDQLRVVLGDLVAVAATPEGMTVARVLTNELDHPEVAELSRELRAQFHEPWFLVLRRAVARGELPKRTDLKLIVEVLSATVGTRLFRDHEAVDTAFLRALISLVVGGARSGRTASRE